MLAVFGIVEFDTPQMLWVILPGLGSDESNGLIASQSGGLVHLARANATKQKIGFATDDEERLCLVQRKPAGKIGEATIHDVEAPRFRGQDVEYIDLVHFTVNYVHKSRNIAAQIKQCMHLDGGFALTKLGPGEDAQAQIDGSCIERINRLFQLQRKAVTGVKCSGDLNQAHRAICVNATLSLFVRIGHRALGNVATDAQVVEPGLMGTQASFDVAQAFALSQLRKGHTKKLIQMRERFGGIF
jgi:hypothetical protein